MCWGHSWRFGSLHSTHPTSPQGCLFRAQPFTPTRDHCKGKGLSSSHKLLSCMGTHKQQSQCSPLPNSALKNLPLCFVKASNLLSDSSDLHGFARSTAPGYETRNQRLSCSDYSVLDRQKVRFVLPAADHCSPVQSHQGLGPTGTAQLAQVSSAHWNEPTLPSFIQDKVMVLTETTDTFQLNHWTWVQASGNQHRGEE